eukprot:CAMPEP_0113882072 /NCGR_PEP_ID=MMETSP0780_2-20120614/8736_1 /TAXON_ID=652834 /ORGANISM="Palpitomonas bilix" /LENGTH=126 /DNA_ID=CAMNT_0000869015 /DNA_START=40 /DNA_END=421 /DNA_ORIENTATION=+ /assembly_acc=CAM_ASM_000599
MADDKSVKAVLLDAIGFLPKDAFAWLYAARGFYRLGDYRKVVECTGHCLRNPKTAREAQHLLAFSLQQTGQAEAAALAFSKSIEMGNETDWQSLVELCYDNPDIELKHHDMSMCQAQQDMHACKGD